MDPNTALSNLRAALAAYNAAVDAGNEATAALAAASVAEASAALDGWMSRGGFIPREWQRMRAAG